MTANPNSDVSPRRASVAALSGLEAANVVIMSDHIARLRDEGRIQRRGYFFTAVRHGANVIDLVDYRLEKLREQYC